MANYIKNKQLYVLNDSGEYEAFYTVNDEVFLVADTVDNTPLFISYIQAVTSPFSYHVHRVELLNSNETVKEDVSEFVSACSVSFTHGNGSTRSSSLTFLNTDNRWTPSPINGRLWKGSKFKIYAGLFYNGKVFWNDCGIFTPADPTIDESAQTVQAQMYDKFAFLDGIIAGKIDSDFKISVGTPIRTAIEMCLVAEKGNGRFYDNKPVIFPLSKETITTPYTITKSPELTYGEIIIELAEMISCDVFYNSNGNLVVDGDSDDILLEDKPIIWHFNDAIPLHTKPSTTMNMSQVVNKVTVVGAIENGYRFKGVAINNDAKSPTNVNMTETNPLYIEDSKLYSDKLCLDRARYELKNQSLLGMQVKFDCVFIPSLIPNNLVAWSNIQRGYVNRRFFINSVDYDVINGNSMSISLTNIDDVMCNFRKG